MIWGSSETTIKTDSQPTRTSPTTTKRGKQEKNTKPKQWAVLEIIEPPHVKTNKVACAPNEVSDQPGHPPSLIRVFAVRYMGSLGPKLSSGGQRRLWSDCADVQADLSLRWAHMPFCWICHNAAHLFTVKAQAMSRCLINETSSRKSVCKCSRHID